MLRHAPVYDVRETRRSTVRSSSETFLSRGARIVKYNHRSKEYEFGNF